MHKGSEKCNKGKLIVHYIATTYAPIVVYLTASCIYSKHAIFVAYKLLPQLLFVCMVVETKIRIEKIIDTSYLRTDFVCLL